MNSTLTDMKNRRSIRKFKPDAVSDELIEQIIEAGLYAASGKNSQLPIIVAVTNKQETDKLRAANASIMGSSFDPFYGAPVILVVLTAKDRPTYVYDGSLVMGNLMLAAHTLGLGSCWIHRAKETFEQEEWKQWLADHGIEGDYEGIGHLALGYVEGEYPAPIPRKENRVFWIR